MGSLQQKLSFLHARGLPSACTHCRENSETVMQTSGSEVLEVHMSEAQAFTKESTSRRFWQLLNAALEKICSQRG